jgi:hypothetical protein
MNAVKRAIIWNAGQGRVSDCCKCQSTNHLQFVDWVDGVPYFYCRAHAHGMKECHCGARARKVTRAYDDCLERTTETYWCGSQHCKPDVTTADGQEPYDLCINAVQ